MKALVTGGGGFLGRAIVDRLLARGDTVASFARGAYPDLCERGDNILWFGMLYGRARAAERRLLKDC